MNITKKKTKYCIGDVIQHNEYPELKREIVWSFTAFYHDEINMKSDIYYQTKTLENMEDFGASVDRGPSILRFSVLRNKDIPPISIKEAYIDLYYTKIQVHQ